MLSLTITVLILAAIPSLIKELINDDKITKSIIYKISMAILIIAAVIISIWLEFVKKANDDYAQTKKENEYKSLITNTNKTIEEGNKANNKLIQNIYLTNTNIDKTESAIERLENLETKNKLIIRSLENQIQISQSIAKQSQDLLTENKILSERQIKQVENEDRQINPAYPFHFLVSLQLPFTSKMAKDIINYINHINLENISDSFLIKNKIRFEYNQKNKSHINSISIINYHETFDSLKSITEDLTHFGIGFIPDSSCDNFKNASISKSILNNTTFLRQTTNQDEIRKQFSFIQVNYEYNFITINFYFTHIIANPLLEKTNFNLGLRDLKNNYLYIILPSSITVSNLNVAQIYIGRQFRDPIPITLRESEYNYTKRNILFHKFMFHEIEWKHNPGQDVYKIYYYGEGTGSLGFKDPDF